MAVLRRLAHLPLHRDPIDVWLSKWGNGAGGLLLLALTVAVLPSLASGWAERLLGIGLAAVACSILALFGVLSSHVHRAWHRGAAPWRTRVGEFAGLGIGIGVAGSGLGCLVMLRLEPAGMIIGGLLVTSLAVAIICLGLCSTLSNTALKDLSPATRRKG